MENLDVSVLEIVQLSLNGTIPVQQNDFPLFLVSCNFVLNQSVSSLHAGTCINEV